ncbi:MAG: AAA family ATPase [Candidatus Omnitrophota bacterium]
MGYVIAMAGNGGRVKTTLAALIVRIIREKKLGSILAVDADPNSNLSDLLGLELKETVGQIIDDVAACPEKVPSGMSKGRFIEFEIQTSIQEAEGFDLLVMGRPEGPGCYCYANNVLRNIMSKLIHDYDYVVIDNEAGLEHLSRRTTRSANALVIVSDATPVGLKAASRISDLAKELKIDIKREFLIVNRYEKNIESEKLKKLKSDYLGSIPFDREVEIKSLNGSSLMDLDDNSISLSALRKLGGRIWQCN